MTDNETALKILLLCDFRDGTANAIIDHISSFTKYSRHEYRIRNCIGDSLANIDLEELDAIFIHYSLVACYDSYIAPATRRRIRAFRGYKAAFIQDDYRFINRTVDALSYMGIHALFSLAGPDIIEQVYSNEKLPGVRKVTVLAGYVPEALNGISTPPYRLRPIDVGYRARKLPAWMGSHTLQKWQIAEKFQRDANEYGLRVDFSCREEDRIYGDGWIDFLMNCKATLGTESGASVCDFTGEIQQNVEEHVALFPDTTFEELRDLYFRDEDGRLMMNVVSPRCFEAAALKTLLIMYEGEYSGVLAPWRHYVPLKRDHSNMDQVLEILRNPDRAERIIETAYEDLVASGQYCYRSMISLVDSVVDETVQTGMLSKFRKGTESERSKFSIAFCLFKINTWLNRLPWSSINPGGTVDLPGLISLSAITTDSELHIYLDAHNRCIEFIVVPLNAGPLPQAQREVSMDSVRQFLRTASSMRVRWLTKDPLGLDKQHPLNQEFDVLLMADDGYSLPSKTLTRLLCLDTAFKWYSKVFMASGSALNRDRPVQILQIPVEMRCHPIWCNVKSGLREVCRVPRYCLSRAWSGLPAGTRTTLLRIRDDLTYIRCNSAKCSFRYCLLRVLSSLPAGPRTLILRIRDVVKYVRNNSVKKSVQWMLDKLGKRTKRGILRIEETRNIRRRDANSKKVYYRRFK